MSPAEINVNSGSTGPRTPEGKRKASHNALRHGLTGRVVVMPWEDMDAYDAFCKELMAELAPVGALEKQYAQTFCDTQWRLNRARSFEEGIFLLDQMEGEHIGVGHHQANNAMIAARAFRDNSKAFTNLTLYEQRLHRTLKESLLQLQELQTARKAAPQTEPAAESEPEASAPQPPKTVHASVSAFAPGNHTEFVFSTPQPFVENHRPHLDPDAAHAFPGQEAPEQKAA